MQQWYMDDTIILRLLFISWVVQSQALYLRVLSAGG